MRAVLSIVVFMSGLNAFAQPMADMDSKEFRDAMERSIEACAPEPVRGSMARQYGTSKSITEMVCTVAPWPGQCVDGKRDGPGEVRQTCDSNLRMGNDLTVSKHVTVSRGTLVRGKFAGLVENFMELSPFTAGDPPTRFHFFRFAEGHPPGMFAKSADGSYQPILDAAGKPAPTPALPAAEVERLSAGLIADARTKAGGGQAAPRIVAVKALEDLLPGGQVQFAPVRQIADAKGKSLAVVFSNGTLKDSERYKAMLRTMKAEARSIPEVRDSFGVHVTASERIRYLEKVEPPAVLEGVFLSLAKSFKSVAPVDDLGAAKAMNADYSMVLDVTFPSATTPFLCDMHFIDRELRLVGSLQCALGGRHYAELFTKWRDPDLNRFSLGYSGERSNAPPDVMLVRSMTATVDAMLKQLVPQ